MKTTINKGYKKPEYLDAADIQLINQNFDSIDTDIKNLEDTTAKVIVNSENKITNDITGNANTATKFKTPVNIFGLSFDGSKDIAEDDNHKLVTKTEKIIIKESSNPNLLINGDFQVWQRGTDINGRLNTYTADRFHFETDGLLRMYKNSIGTKFQILETKGWNQIFTTIEILDNFKGKTMTYSIKFKLSQPLIPNSQIGIIIMDSEIIRAPIKDSTLLDWQITTVTFKVKNYISTFKIGLDIFDGLELEYIKLELGTIATPTTPRPYAEELVLCKRYYEKGFYVSQYTGNSVPVNMPFFIPIRYTVEKRIVPTFTATSGKGTANRITGVLSVTTGTGDDVFMAPGGGTNNSQFIGFVSHNPVYHTYNFNWTADAEIY